MTCGKCGSANIIEDRLSATGLKCLMCGSERGIINGTLSEEQEAVWNCIKDRKGIGSEIKRKEISARTGLGDVAVRKAVSTLVNGHGRVIGSNRNGYYIPVTIKERDQVARSLRHRGIMILMRSAQITKSDMDNQYAQGKLEFESGK